MAKAKHYKSSKARLAEHKKDPKSTGCIWSHHDYGKGNSWESHPCHYQNNGFKESKGARLGMYKPDQAKVDEANRDKRKLSEDASGEYKQQVEKAREDLAQQQASMSSGAKLQGRDYFRYFVAKGRMLQLETQGSLLLRKHILGYGRPLHRLALNKDAWTPGHKLDKSLANREYLGLSGNLQSKKKGITTPVNFAPERHDLKLGAWYPYDHEYHHIIPRGSLTSALLRGAKSVPFERRLSTLTESKWNMHNPDNVVLLSENTVIANIINLPAHCPWGASGHKLYSDMIESRLMKIAEQMEADLQEAGEPHEVEKKAGAQLLTRLNALSKHLFSQIKTNKVFLS
ncbi:AHH domain-containing protein [Corallococcus terminator]